MDDARAYRTVISEKRRELSRLVALQQRELAALAKMDEAADELEQVEHEKAALARGETQPEQPAETTPSDPQMTGERALTILKAHRGARLNVVNVVDGWMEQGWSEDTPEERQRVKAILRHSLARLARRNDHVERDERGPTYYYWYVSRDSDARTPARISQPAVPGLTLSNVAVNGTALPAVQGGLTDG